MLIRTATTQEVMDHLLGSGDIRGFLEPGGVGSGTPVTLKKVFADVLGDLDIVWLLPTDLEAELEEEQKRKAEMMKMVAESFAKEFTPSGNAADLFSVLDESDTAASVPEELTGEAPADPEELTGETAGGAEDPEPEEPETGNSLPFPGSVYCGETEAEAPKEVKEVAAVPDAANPPARKRDREGEESTGGGSDEGEAVKEKKIKPEFPGKWEKFMDKALSTPEAKDICFQMTDEGYGPTQISRIIRFSAQTVLNWRKKREHASL